MTDKKVLISAGIIAVLAASLVFYFNHEINKAEEDYNAKINSLASVMENGLLNLRASVNNLSSEIGIVDNNLESFKAQSGKEITTLLELIEEIEKQSNIQLNELKDELKNVQIKSQDFSAIIDDVLASTVSLQTNKGQGSGVVINDGSYIVTNYHVVNGATGVRVSTYSGSVYYAQALIGYDDDADVAVLKINVNLEPLLFGDSDSVKIGEKVIAAGNPAGLSFTVTEGIVSAKREFDSTDYLQTDVPINPGNSGGPLLNAKGEIVGINNFKVDNYEGLGFAISSNEASSIAQDIIDDYEAQVAAQQGQ
jgi:serine protease Do